MESSSVGVASAGGTAALQTIPERLLGQGFLAAADATRHLPAPTQVPEPVEGTGTRSPRPRSLSLSKGPEPAVPRSLSLSKGPKQVPPPPPGTRSPPEASTSSATSPTRDRNPQSPGGFDKLSHLPHPGPEPAVARWLRQAQPPPHPPGHRLSRSGRRFARQQALLHPRAPREAAERPVSAQHAVAGDEQRDGVARADRGCGAHGSRRPEGRREAGVRQRCAGGDRAQRLPPRSLQGVPVCATATASIAAMSPS